MDGLGKDKNKILAALEKDAKDSNGGAGKEQKPEKSKPSSVTLDQIHKRIDSVIKNLSEVKKILPPKGKASNFKPPKGRKQFNSLQTLFIQLLTEMKDVWGD